MPPVSFSLRPEDIVRFHDAISCLSKFSDLIGLEAHQGKVGVYLHLLVLHNMLHLKLILNYEARLDSTGLFQDCLCCDFLERRWFPPVVQMFGG